MVKQVIATLTALVGFGFLFAQETFPVNGPQDERPIYFAFKNATIYTSANEKLTNATLVVYKGKIHAVGKGVSIPSGAVVKDCEGLVIYPSFIDAYGALNKPKSSKDKPEMVPHSHWNPSIHPEYQYQESFPIDDKKQHDWLASGFGVVNQHHRQGIMRGAAQLIHVGLDQPNESILRESSTAQFSFAKGASDVDYPTSHMGAVALLRQAYYDAQWYNATIDLEREHTLAYEIIEQQKSMPSIFDVGTELSVRNVKALENEFGLDFIIKGNGREYLLDQSQLNGQQFILPLNFPNPFDVSDPFEARMVSLEQLKHWESAPFNAYYLKEKGADFIFTRDTLSSKAFLKNLNRLTNAGLSHNEVLEGFTSKPAEWLGISDAVGTLESGKLANFFIANHSFDQSGFAITEHWNKGQLVFHKSFPDESLVGTYKLVVDGENIELEVKAVSEKGIQAEAHWKEGNADLTSKVKLEKELISIVLITKDQPQKMLYQLSGKLSLNGSVWDGKGQTNRGKWVTWAAIKDRKSEDEKQHTITDSNKLTIPSLSYPNMAYGFDEMPAGGTFVMTNAKVWTCADTGFIENADIYVVDGKINYIGKDRMFPTDVPRINAQGKHVTPGIIDEHSHIGIYGGANEWGQASSAEVRIADAIDPFNMNIYRQLAGGVTAAQLLHGSANPIGGQSALIELKWGTSADEMLIDGAPGFIKFALGENVKRSNGWKKNTRYPNTRMGVEQVFADHFIRAKEYAASSSVAETVKKRSKPVTSETKKRIDLELKTLVEILNDERYITCHSYVQSEILMLINIADSLGFRINTFTHILEGYKVADEMVAHGAAGSTFADWWAYKFEVNDAIPYNAKLMHDAGVLVAINSDDAEMGRRLNQEAAKSVKYGGMSEEEALKMVTINPAKMLHLDDQMGSIEVGKKANLVVWSDHPLSIYSQPEKTLIEGVVYYDLSKQEWYEERIAKERARIISMMIEDNSGKKQKVKSKEDKHYHCDTMLENYWEE